MSSLSLFGPLFPVSVFSTSFRTPQNSIVVGQRNMDLLLPHLIHLTNTREFHLFRVTVQWRLFSPKSKVISPQTNLCPFFSEIPVSLLLKHNHSQTKYFPKPAWLKHLNIFAISLLLFHISTTSYFFFIYNLLPTITICSLCVISLS